MAINGDWCLLLLRAAEVVEKKDREIEHGYASTRPIPTTVHHRQRRLSMKMHSSRNMHNELEKTRRANLRWCLERLKEIVPVGPNSSRHTTLGLLNRSAVLIKSLEDQDRRQQSEKNQLLNNYRNLQQRLHQLTNGRYRETESSPLTTNSTSSEQDDVDVIGYTEGSTGSSDYDDEDSSNSSV